MGKTYTKGSVIVEDIKVGDIHYEYDMGLGIRCKVMELPVFSEKEEGWTWTSENLKTREVIKYFVNPKYSHYSANLYDYEAYNVKEYI